jgi:diacylglycerol kinase family enzyme
VPQPSSVAVILNRSAGVAKAQSHLDTEVRHLFGAAGVDVEIIALRQGQNPADAAREAASRASVVVAAGGDGTVSSVVSGIADSPAALGILPLGTLNHFAKDLHLPLGLREAVAVVVAGHIGRVDAGSVNGRLFVNNVSLGVYPGIVEQREELRGQGHRKWKAMTIATMRVLRGYPGTTVKIVVDGDVRTWQTPFVFVGNNEYGIDGLRIGARARLDEGKLFVYLAPRARARDLPVLLAKALIGRATASGALEIVFAPALEIHPHRGTRIRVAIDGEVATMRTPLQYRICPGALRVLLPRT